MKNKVLPILPLTLKVLLGVLFLVSAVVKIIGMDAFEIYIYSYGFFSLNITFLLARVAIIAELLLGVALIINCMHKAVWWASVLMLIGYSLFLVYALYLGRTDNCHCFGELVDLDPRQSLLKNLLFLLLFSFTYRVKPSTMRRQIMVMTALAVFSTVVVFVASPPDFMTSDFRRQQEMSEGLYAETFYKSPYDTLKLDEGKKIVALFTTGCSFCQMSASKLSVMQKHLEIPDDHIFIIFVGNKDDVDAFYEKARSARFSYLFYDNVNQFLRITDGNFPLIILSDDGVVKHRLGFRSLDEDLVKSFFQE